MEPREYFKAVAKELEGIKAPEDHDIEEMIDFVWSLWENNISVSDAAMCVLQKFGVATEERPN